VRGGDKNHLVFYEPNVIFNDGADTQLPKFDDDKLGMSWHNYCLVGDVSGSGGGGGGGCGTMEGLVFQNALKRSEATADTQLLTEFGATDDLDTLRRITAASDDYMVGWQYWHYCGCNDPTTQGPGETQAIVKDPAKPPEGDNLKSEKLGVLVRPYPQLIAGTPASWKFDADKKAFELEYSTQRADGGTFAGHPLTEVFVPKRHYPGGYSVRVQGAGVASGPGAQLLELQACPGARTAKLEVSPSGPNVSDCAAGAVAGLKISVPRLHLAVSPRRVHRGRMTTFTFRVKAGRFAVRGACVRLAGRSARTDARGRARIRVRLMRPGMRRAAAWNRTYRQGAAHVRVVR
jgi:endoglycosylceramidase